ncbi:MFS transporter [Plantactinospora endophytica]|uniref:MFS transporter n=1 Tax=Plantactinospora endophytica TaxID=673535 RepID=A0ABQ4DXL0_9ACTN|nr:MFS transporter [Plantactinospora endophytica]
MVGTGPATGTTAGALRRLLWGRGVSALGDGMWFTIWALYLTGIVGISAGTVGIGMAVAAAFGLAAAVPLGALADRHDPRRVLVVIAVVRTAAMAGYLLVDGVWSFLVVTVAFVALANGGSAVRTALVAALVRDNRARVRELARQRVAQHVGYAAGAGLGAAVLAVDRPVGYTVAIAANAVTFAVFAVVTATVPGRRVHGPTRPVRANVRAAVGDLPYVGVTAAVALLSLCWAMLSTGLPLWISQSTRLPLVLSGIVVVISSVGIAAGQVPATRLARTPAAATRTAVCSGVALAVSCLLLASTSGGAGPVAVTVVVVAALAHLAGELGYVASSWALSLGLAREQALGAYQGLAEAATATVQIFGPALFTLAVGGHGTVGWLVVAAIFLLAASLLPTLVRRALRNRPADV